MANYCTGRKVLKTKRKKSRKEKPGTDIVFHEQYISQPCIKSSFKVKCSIMNNPFRYGYGYYQMLAEVFEEFNDYDPFCGRTYGNWSNEAPPKMEDFMPQNNDEVVSHDYLEITLPKKFYPIRISILETYAPGTVVRIWAWDELTNYWQKLWSGPPQACQNRIRIFTPPLAICKFKTKIIRLELNYSLAYYYTQLASCFLFGTKNLVLPKDDIKDHSLINVIPTWQDAKCAIPEKANDTHNLSRHVSHLDSFLADQEIIKFIILENYVKREQLLDTIIPESPSRVETPDNRNERSLNDFPVRKHNKQ